VSIVTSETLEALRVAIPETLPPTGNVTEGELARTALIVLSEQAENRERLQKLIDASELEALGVLETIGLATAVMVVLQTHARFERDKNGKLHFLIEKRPTKAGLIEPLIQKLLAWSTVGSAAEP
jgi:Holliday junction resolvasome RuvABC DNA-binding subunit